MKRLIAIVFIISFIFGQLCSCTQSKSVCGTKKQHKQRTAKMKRMAPTM